jgi:hypothetical protein
MKPIQWFSEEITDVVKPVIRDFFIDVYEKPDTYIDPDVKDTGGGNQLIKFQIALKKIPNWTTTQIKKQIDEIKHRCPGFKQLLVALFVTYINKISKDIRTSSKARRLDVKLPSDETFVHTCFVNCAHNLYEDPYVMKKSEYERASDLDHRLEKCISVSIRKLIPTLDIINNYIPNLGDEMSFNSDQPQPLTTEPDEPSSTSDEPSAAATAAATAAAPVAEEEEDEESAEELKGGEPKTIETSTELFPDAPDKILTKQ